MSALLVISAFNLLNLIRFFRTLPRRRNPLKSVNCNSSVPYFISSLFCIYVKRKKLDFIVDTVTKSWVYNLGWRKRKGGRLSLF